MVAPVRLVARCRLSFYLESGKTLEWHSPPFGLRCSLFRVPSPPKSTSATFHSLILSLCLSLPLFVFLLRVSVSVSPCIFVLRSLSTISLAVSHSPSLSLLRLSLSRRAVIVPILSHSHRNSTGDRIIHLYEDLKSEVAIEALYQFLLILQLSNFVSC